MLHSTWNVFQNKKILKVKYFATFKHVTCKKLTKMCTVHFKCSFPFVLRISHGDNFSDNDKADEEQGVEQQTVHEEAIDYDQHHFLVNAEPNNEQPHDESTSFIMVDSTSGSSDSMQAIITLPA